MFRNLHAADEGHVHPPSSDHSKRLVAADYAAAWGEAHGLLASIAKVWVTSLFGLWIWAHPKKPVLGVNRDVMAVR